MIELILNGVNIDLTGNEDVALSFAASKLQDIKSRNGDFSTTFKVPLTNDVKQAIDYSNNFTSNSSFPYRVAEAEIRESGVTVMRGFARIEKIASELEVNVFSGNSNWFDLIREKELQDLNLSDLNITFNEANVEANRLNDYTKGFCFPNAWYGKFASDSKPFWLYDFFPAVYCHRILKQIFEDIGWVVSGNLLNDSIFRKAATIFSNEKLGADNVIVIDNANLDVPFSLSSGSFKYYLGINSAFSDPFTSLTFDTISGTLSGAATIEIWDDNYYEFAGDISFVNSGVADGYLVLRAIDGGESIDLVNGMTSTSMDWGFESQLIKKGIYVLEWNFTSSGIISSFTGSMYLTCASNYSFKQNIPKSHLLVMNRALPESMKQLDFLLTIVNQFNILITTDKANKTVTFNTFSSIIENKTNSVDWSKKVDLNTQPELVFLSDHYSRKNWFKYQNDDKDLLIDNLGVGNSFFLIDDKNLPESNDIFESVFSASVTDRSRFLPIFCAPIRLESINFRIGCISITNDNLIKQFGQATPTQSAEVFFSELSFEKLIPKYYSGLVVAFNRFKMIRLYLNLTAADINQIDYMKPIYLHFTSDWIGQVNGYFYLNLVDQYKPGAGETTLVELVRI